MLALFVSVLLPGPSQAVGTKGEITSATLGADGTTARIAGSVTWEGCEAPIPDPLEPPREPPEEGEPEEEPHPIGILWPLDSCNSDPYLTIGPGATAADCGSTSRDLSQLPSADVVLAWDGTELRAPGSQSFDVSAVPVPGVGRLVCLATRETGSATCFGGRLDEVCEHGFSTTQILAAALLAEPGGPLAGSAPPAPGSGGRITHRRCRNRTRATPVSRRKKCGKRHRGHKSFSRGKEISVS